MNRRFLSQLHKRAGFTLFEVVLALMVLGLLAGAVYSIAGAALEATKTISAEQAAARRLEAFLRILRDSFQCIPARGQVFLRFSESVSGAPVPEIVFRNVSGAFGVPSLGGGSLILAARPRSDGSRSFSILPVPARMQGVELEMYLEKGPWVPLLPGVERVVWRFFDGTDWVEEWPEGAGRPTLVSLGFTWSKMPGAVLESVFWLPPLAPPGQGTPNNQ